MYLHIYIYIYMYIYIYIFTSTFICMPAHAHSHRDAQSLMSHVTHMNHACPTNTCGSHTYECLMSHI